MSKITIMFVRYHKLGSAEAGECRNQGVQKLVYYVCNVIVTSHVHQNSDDSHLYERLCKYICIHCEVTTGSPNS